MRKNLSFALLIILILYSFNSFAVSDNSVWEKIKSYHFADTIIHENTSDLLFIQVPKKVEDSAVVPIKITSLMAQSDQHHIKKLYLFIDNNPDPLAATFHLSPAFATSGNINIATRIRIDSFSHVRIIAEMNDGSLHLNSRFVIAAGGCSAPSSSKRGSTDSGKRIKIRLNHAGIDQTIKTRILINHPNTSGLQFDQTNGQYIPAHYVTSINISYNDKMLINAETGISISENPTIGFSFKPAEKGSLKIRVKDSNDQEFYKEIEQPVR